MNIFVLHSDPSMAVTLMCDQHIVKMPLESTQLVCTHLREHGVEFDGQYRSTHRNHPCRLWLDQPGALRWLLRHGDALFTSFAAWRGKEHGSRIVWNKAMVAAHKAGLFGAAVQPTAFVQCVPQQYQQTDAVRAYRAYYAGDKAQMARYRWNDMPSFML